MRNYFKRSLVLCLVFMLTISGVDLSVFADEGAISSDISIASPIRVATTFYENVVPNETVLNSGWGIRANSVTIPLDLTKCDDASSYTQSNVDSIVLRCVTDNTEVTITGTNTDVSMWSQYSGFSATGGYANFTSYLSRGYYSLGFSDMLASAFEKYVVDNNLLDMSKSQSDLISEGTLDDFHQSYKDLALDWLNSNREFTLSMNFKNGKTISTEVFVYPVDYIESGNTGGTSISDILNKDIEFDDGDGYGIYSDAVWSTGEHTVIISVPTSKTVKNKDFYKGDDNAIFYRKDGEYLDTYYVDVDSDKNISIPFNEISKGLDITQVKVGDNTVYDTYESIQLNGGSDLVSEDYSKGYTVTKTDKLQSIGKIYDFGTTDSEDYIELLKKVFGEDTIIKYNNKDYKIDDCKDIPFEDLYKSGEVYYAKRNGGLLGSGEYNGEDDTEYDCLYDFKSIDNHNASNIESNFFFMLFLP